ARGSLRALGSMLRRDPPRLGSLRLSSRARADPRLSMIRVDHVTKRYSQGAIDVFALKEVSLDIERGQFVSIMGPSGSGKSTLLHLMGALDRPSSGEVSIDGKSISAMSDDERTMLRRVSIGFVFQFFNLLPTLSAVENV